MSTETNGSFELSPLWQDVQATILSGPRLVNQKTDILVHTTEGDFPVLKVLEIQEKHDYSTDVCGTIFLKFILGLGDYTYKLYPFRDTLEVTIKTTPLREDSSMDLDADIDTVRYRAILDLKKNPGLTGKKVTNQDYQTLNLNHIVEVSLELQDRNLELLRVATIPGGIYPDATPEQLIAGILTGESNKFIVDGAPAIQGFDLVKPDNAKPIKNAFIPVMKLSLVPTYVQEKLQGVYSSGLGTHYQRYKGKPSWYVYPLFNTDRFKDDVERVVFFSLPQDRMSGLDRTWRKEGKILYIAVTGNQQYTDDSQVGDMNQGVGFRMPSATGIMTKPVNLTPSGPVADRSRLNTEIGNKTRRDGVYYAPTVAPSTNPFKEYSKVAARQTSSLNLIWENSNGGLIYPGMPCKYVFMDQGEYKEATGVILGKYSVNVLIGAPMTSSVYKVSTHLGVCLEYYSDIPSEQPDSKSPGKF